MEKKNNTGLIIILFIIILGLVGYIVYDKVLSKDTDKNVVEVEKNKLSLAGTYDRGTCAETGIVDCATLVITKQDDKSIDFELSAYKGDMEKGPNIGNLSGTAILDGENSYKFYKNEYDTETTILFKFDKDKITIEESYSTGNNPYAGHGVYFSGTYEKNNSTNKDEISKDESENKYNSIIEEYRKAMKDENYSNNADNETKYPYINDRMMFYYHTYDSVKFNYVYYDINKDGKNELIVGDGENSIFEVYTYNNNPVRLFKDETCLGDRCSLKLWDNGIMYFYGSSGASIHGLTFYKIDTDGYSRKTVKDYEVEYDENHNVTITDNISKNVTRFTSDDEVISSVKGNAKDIDLSKLDWKEIK